MVAKIKTALRISHNALDYEIQDDINACLLDMQRVGIDTSDYQKDALLGKCVELYCKAEYDFAGKSEAFRRAYESTRDAISLCGDYSVQ